jgi:hypothetical protein
MLLAAEAVAALMFQLPEAPVPVGDGTSLPIANPRFVLASEALEAPVPPSAIARSVIPLMEPPVIDTLLEACVAIVPRPRDVRAVDPDSATTLCRYQQ